MSAISGSRTAYEALVVRLRDEMATLLPQLRTQDDAIGFVLRRGSLAARVDQLDAARAIVSWLYQGRLALRTVVPLDGRCEDLVADLTGFFCGVPLQALRLGKPYLPTRDRFGRERLPRLAQRDAKPPHRSIAVAPMTFVEFSNSVDARAREVVGPLAGRTLVVETAVRATLWLSSACVARVWTSGNNEAVGKIVTRTGLPLRKLASTRLDALGVETAAQFVARVVAGDDAEHLYG